MNHSEANKIGKLCNDLRGANRKNSEALASTKSEIRALTDLDQRLRRANQNLAISLREARRGLFRFGYLSHLWRLLRYKIQGYYYTGSEFHQVNRLGEEVARFVNAFKNG